MNLKSFFNILIIYSTFCNTIICHADKNPDKANSISAWLAIAQEHLKSIVSDGFTDDSSAEDDQRRPSEIIKSKVAEQLNPHPHKKRNLILALLVHHNTKKSKEQQDQSTLDTTTWNDLQLLCGPKGNQHHYIAHQLDKTHTEFGRLQLYKKITHPLTNTHDLMRQQQTIKNLVHNKELFETLDNHIKELLPGENAITSFFEPNEILGLLTKDSSYYLPGQENFPKLRTTIASLNKSPLALQYLDLTDMASTAFAGLIAACGAIAVPYNFFTGKSLILWIKAKNLRSMGLAFEAGVWYAALNQLCKSSRGKSLITGAECTDSVLRNIMLASGFRERLRIFATTRTCMQEKLMHVAHYLETVEHICSLAEQNPSLEAQVPALAHLRKTIHQAKKYYPDMEQLNQLLSSSTFKGHPSFFSYHGRILAAYTLMHTLRNNFIDVMLAVGELDAQLSICNLYKQAENSGTPCCFPTFLNEQSLEPSIEAIDFINPAVDANKVIPSSISIGQCSKKPANVIITGANAAGKSTITKALILNIIIAQGLGIAPARSLTFTPFTHIRTFIDINDDAGSGNSHFKASIARARILKTIAEQLKTGQKAIFAFDELFNDTSHKEGRAAAKALIKILGNNPNVVCIVNTHFTKTIPQLATDTKRFANYRVIVNFDKNGKPIPTFKLEPGISTQTVTLKLLEQEGFDDEFIKLAQEELDNDSDKKNNT